MPGRGRHLLIGSTDQVDHRPLVLLRDRTVLEQRLRVHLERLDLRVRVRDVHVLARAHVGHAVQSGAEAQHGRVDVAVPELHGAVQHQVLELLAPVDQCDLRLAEGLQRVALEDQEVHRVPQLRVGVPLDAQQQLVPGVEGEERVTAAGVPGDDLVPVGHDVVHAVLLRHRLSLLRRRVVLEQGAKGGDVPAGGLRSDQLGHLALGEVAAHEHLGRLPHILHPGLGEHVVVVEDVVLHRPRLVGPLHHHRAHGVEPDGERGHHRGEQVLLHLVRVQHVADHLGAQDLLGEDAAL